MLRVTELLFRFTVVERVELVVVVREEVPTELRLLTRSEAVPYVRFTPVLLFTVVPELRVVVV